MELKRTIALVCLALAPGLALGQMTTITGSVTDDEGDTLIGANVIIQSLILGGSTDLDGNYSFQVPVAHVGETLVLTAKFIGYSDQERTVTLTAGTMTENFVLSLDLLNLDELVVTGVAEATPRKKLAFTVDQVTSEEITLAPASNPVSSLQGKVPGAAVQASSGTPGDAVSVRLRGATSITGNNQPLYIVDGVILGSNQVDFDALDIENVEIVKGAAASSLYGSRAQNGVINITTRRGTNVPLNQTRVTIRNEYGFNRLGENLVTNRSHDLKVDASGNFLNAAGEKNTCATCLPNGYGPGVIQEKNPHGAAFYDEPYQGQLYDAFDQFFNPGDTWTNYVGISQNSSKTNFLASFSNIEEQGAIQGLQGLNRKSFRVNLDHRVRSSLIVSSSAYYSQSTNDARTSSLASNSFVNPFFGLMFTNPLVDLEARDEAGELIVQADPLAVEENPLYNIANTTMEQKRSRVLGNFRARWSPTDWVDLESNFSYDRSDRDEFEFYDIGFKTIDANPIQNGRIERRNAVSEAINAYITASFRKRFGALTTRGQLKAQIEDYNNHTEYIIGLDLVTPGITDLSNVETDGEKNLGNSQTIVRSEGYYGTVGIDYADRYIADLFMRRDGSSLFGSEERWQTYFRASGAWRLSEEAWWPAKNSLTEFKLRGSIGTAGGRPRYEWQYETLFLANGVLTKSTLGNKFLKPELQTEMEVGIDVAFRDRVFLELVYADTKVEDLLLAVPLAGFYGFSSQWQNAGAIESNTVEANLDFSAINTRDLGVDVGIIFDRTRQQISGFNSNPFQGGPLGLFFIREGEHLGTMYGDLWITDKSQLPEDADPNLFDVNDDGYLVAVGSGNTHQSGPGPDGMLGTEDDLWGMSVEDASGNYNWGMPIRYFDTEENTTKTIIADAVPDFNIGVNTTVRFKGIHLYMLWGAQVGGDVYNFTKQWSYRDGRAADQDQGQKAEGLKKSTAYYEALYDATGRNSHFVEDATYLKLRELSVGYTFNRSQLERLFGTALHSVGISVIGRNLITMTGYTGFDPEVGSSDSGSNVGGDATLYRVDDFNYPPFRTVRAKLEIQF